MSVLTFWGREVRHNRERNRRLRVEASRRADRVENASERLKRATTHAEKAALALLARDDEFMEAAANRR